MAKSLVSFPILHLHLLLLFSSGILLKLANGQQGKTWCVAKPSTDDAALAKTINFACDALGTMGLNCSQIQQGGACYYPNTRINHASYVMNSYYRHYGPTTATNCNFGNSGLVTVTDPSYGSCQYE